MLKNTFEKICDGNTNSTSKQHRNTLDAGPLKFNSELARVSHYPGSRSGALPVRRAWPR